MAPVYQCFNASLNQCVIPQFSVRVVFWCKISLQVLGKLYAVLSDKEQKAIYDEQGVVDEESDVLKQDRCWEDYWRLLFPKVP